MHAAGVEHLDGPFSLADDLPDLAVCETCGELECQRAMLVAGLPLEGRSHIRQALLLEQLQLGSELAVHQLATLLD